MWRLDEGSLALLAELDAMMLAHAGEIVQMGFDFGVEVLKGKTTQRLRGKIADAVRGSARTKDALTWCRFRGLHTFVTEGKPLLDKNEAEQKSAARKKRENMINQMK